MTEKFLKRFEKLENIPPDMLVNEGIQISRRFERLEIGDKRIEIAITDTVSRQEIAPKSVNYWVICPYCGAENTSDSDNCILCKHILRTKLAEEIQEKALLMKKCSVCGATNQQERKNCWVCGKRLFEEASEKNSIDTTNTIILNLNGKEYRSTDNNLPPEIKELMARIRKEGYSKELIDDWARKKAAEDLSREKNLDGRIRQVQTQYNANLTSIIIFSIFALLFILSKLSGCR
jgi:ribosomal protein L40E